MPDFRGRMEIALEIFDQAPPDVMNHNLETVPRLYKQARPGSDYQYSLDLLKAFKARHPDVPTKSGLMVGLGETDEEILEVMRDLRAHDVEMLTIGQYLQPSGGHLPVLRYVHPDTFKIRITSYNVCYTKLLRLHDYQKQRVCTLLDPTSDPLGRGFHIIQSTIAIGSGGLFGKGWLNGTQTHLAFIPERHTDFIFAVLAEEFGLVGAVALLVVLMLLLLRVITSYSIHYTKLYEHANDRQNTTDHAHVHEGIRKENHP